MKHIPCDAMRDCFAFREKIFLRCNELVSARTCTALNNLVCAKEQCPFYKPKEQWEKELLKIHGTESLDAILTEYQERLQEGSEMDEQRDMD